ncbi:MAG: hypothetical protein UR26_C0010G0007 [candidate division TM6 bacterium GW2011_GWF2_32_72]|nr:MAG: hypothetical protein UR26_C0010G0007 [candidate division TM6 bacterium GW2011_GWF2_32_72]
MKKFVFLFVFFVPFQLFSVKKSILQTGRYIDLDEKCIFSQSTFEELLLEKAPLFFVEVFYGKKKDVKSADCSDEWEDVDSQASSIDDLNGEIESSYELGLGIEGCSITNRDNLDGIKYLQSDGECWDFVYWTPNIYETESFFIHAQERDFDPNSGEKINSIIVYVLDDLDAEVKVYKDRVSLESFKLLDLPMKRFKKEFKSFMLGKRVREINEEMVPELVGDQMLEFSDYLESLADLLNAVESKTIAKFKKLKKMEERISSLEFQGGEKLVQLEESLEMLIQGMDESQKRIFNQLDLLNSRVSKLEENIKNFKQ